jgi:hypothetical protein
MIVQTDIVAFVNEQKLRAITATLEEQENKPLIDKATNIRQIIFFL